MRPDDKADVALRFKALRRQASFSQRYLAGLIGVCRQAVSDIENMRTMPRYTTWGLFVVLEAKHLAEAGRTVPTGPWQ
jgi:DNA-binding XRE family transcriptional regulator